MSTRSTKTIDNLGIDVYKRYSEDQDSFEKVYINDSKQVAEESTLDVFLPIYEGEVDTLFKKGAKSHPWALLNPPDKYNEQKRRLFMNQIAPAMGPEERIEIQENRIEEIQKEREKKEKKKDGRNFEWEEEKEEAEIALEAKKLIDLLQDILILNKLILDVNSERYRYNKG
jgi:hypothetical protein